MRHLRCGSSSEDDGGYHTSRAKADARRDRLLSELGWRVVRPPVELMLHGLAQAIAVVVGAVGAANG